jgi:hypothetical protein
MKPVQLAGALALAATTLAAPLVRADLRLPRVSPDAKVMQTIGTTDFTVTYSRPGVKHRVIWGELVPYDKPWRTGANEATTFTTTDPIQFGGRKLAAGTYSLFTIPGKSEWAVVLNSGKDLWGTTGYDSTKDVLRVTMRPASIDTLQEEWMRFSFENLSPNSADLVLRWEKLRLAVPIVVDVNAKVLADCRAAVDTAAANNWRTRTNAARWCMENDQALADARGWLDQALKIERNYTTLTLLARWQVKDGKKADAMKTAEQAIAAGKAAKPPADTGQTEKLLADWKAGK